MVREEILRCNRRTLCQGAKLELGASILEGACCCCRNDHTMGMSHERGII